MTTSLSLSLIRIGTRPVPHLSAVKEILFSVKARKSLFFTLLFLAIIPVNAFSHSPKTPPPHMHSPRKATILSAVIPGAGQIYNRKYWKLPVLYAGFAGTAYLINYNHSKYRKYTDAYAAGISDPKNYPYMSKYSTDDLLTLSNAYHRDRDLSVILATGLYIMNIIDAAVDAHLFRFDVSDNLSIRIIPGLCFPNGSGLSPSLSLHFTKK